MMMKRQQGRRRAAMMMMIKASRFCLFLGPLLLFRLSLVMERPSLLFGNALVINSSNKRRRTGVSFIGSPPPRIYSKILSLQAATTSTSTRESTTTTAPPTQQQQRSPSLNDNSRKQNNDFSSPTNTQNDRPKRIPGVRRPGGNNNSNTTAQEASFRGKNNNRRNNNNYNRNHSNNFGRQNHHQNATNDANSSKPWRADYYTSRRTQRRIKDAAYPRAARRSSALSRATAVLTTLLVATPPQRCNAANLVCALTLSAKLIGQASSEQYRDLFIQAISVLRQLVTYRQGQHHANGGGTSISCLLSARQLCNAAWAIAKHCDRDTALYPSSTIQAAGSGGSGGRSSVVASDVSSTAERWDFNDESTPASTESTSQQQQSHSEIVDAALDEIAVALTKQLQKDPYCAKNGELAMCSWAYGLLRERRRPAGWKMEPQHATTTTTVSRQEQQQRERDDRDIGQQNTNENDDGLDFVEIHQWNSKNGRLFGNSGGSSSSSSSSMADECLELDPPTPTDDLFHSIAVSLGQPQIMNDRTTTTTSTTAAAAARVRDCTWSELANVAWAFANHGWSCSDAAEQLLLDIANEASCRLLGVSNSSNGNSSSSLPPSPPPLSRDIAQIVWSLGTLQSDNFRLTDGLIQVIDALSTSYNLNPSEGDDESAVTVSRPFEKWSSADIVQVSLSLAHARLDELPLLRALYKEALRRLGHARKQHPIQQDRRWFYSWEVSILLWTQARLHLRQPEGDVFDKFPRAAVQYITSRVNNKEDEVETLEDIGIGAQEQANIAWSLTVLEEDSTVSSRLLARIFDEAATSCEQGGVIQLEHAHQLWQALFLLEDENPTAVKDVPAWFRDTLQSKWYKEKARPKISSARHRSLSQSLNLMGVSHYNEHDEDIDVAIVLKPQASWTHETEGQVEPAEGMKVAVEFDGPNHFTRPRHSTTLDDNGEETKTSTTVRALGHSVLKYRLLKRQGWTVVRVPYYEFDKIPFWASMERQRYLQRLLKTHSNIQFSSIDVSEYKPPVSNKHSRFD